MMDHPSSGDAESQDPAIHRAVSEAKRARGDLLGALAHLIAAEALEANAAGSGTGGAMDLCNVATGYFMKGDYEVAARWYRLALMLDPNLAIAYQNLASIHSFAGRTAEAEVCRERAYRIQRVFIECSGDLLRRVLILCVGRTSGNVPVEILLPGDTCCRIKYAIDYAAIEEDGQLPPFDLVFNAIGDPDVAAPLAARLERFVERCDRPLLNRPSAVARTQRHLMMALLGDLDDLLLAPCCSFESPPASRAALRDALAAIGRRLDLDYGGIDFTLLPDGRVLVFEANATMLVHRERNSGMLAHKNLHVQTIVDAFERLQARLSGQRRGEKEYSGSAPRL